MATRPDNRLDDEFTSRLAELDEAVAGDTPVRASVETPEDPLCRRLNKAKACLELIQRVRRAEPTQGLDGSTPGRPSGDALDVDAPPQQIGRFHILRELGRGGYGVVFLAHDPELEREVALKIPRPEVMLTPELRQRFLREAKAAAALNHAHVVPVFESGSVGPIGYIASAFCRGTSLAEWLVEHHEPAAPREAAELVTKLAEAAQHAHSRGVLHRDLKPSNILLEPSALHGVDDEASEAVAARPLGEFSPKISDFGLAKLLDASSEETRTTAILGTPAYMAPEQAAGRTKDIGPEADIYALGAVLYELLVGQPPIKKGTDIATLQAVQFEEPSPPRRIRSDVPRDLEAICLKCLEKDPARRYETATALADDLSRFTAGEPIRARQITTAQRLGRWCRRNPLVAALSITAMMLLMSVAVVAAVGFVRVSEALERESDQRQVALAALDTAKQQRTLAEQNAITAARERDRAEANLREAAGAVDEYFTKMSESRLLDVPGLQPLRRDLLASALRYYEKFVAENVDDPAMRGELAAAYGRVGRITYEVDSFTDSKAALANSIEHYEELLAENSDSVSYRSGLIETLTHLGVVEKRLGELEASADAYLAALEHARQIADAHPDETSYERELATCLAGYAAAMRDLDDITNSSEHYREAIDIFERLLVENPDDEQVLRSLATTYNNRSQSTKSRQQDLTTYENLDERLGDIQRAVELNERLLSARPDDLDRRAALAIGYLNQGELQQAIGQLQSASASLRESRRIAERLVEENPAVIRYRRILSYALQYLAVLMSDSGNSDDAINLYNELLALRDALQADHPDLDQLDMDLKVNRSALAWLQMESGSRSPADCLDDFRAATSAVGLKNYLPYTELGAGLLRAGEAEDSLATLERAINLQGLAARLKVAKPWHIFRDAARANYYIAIARHRLGEKRAARAALEKADEWTDRFCTEIAGFPTSDLSFEGYIDAYLSPLRAEAVAALGEHVP